MVDLGALTTLQKVNASTHLRSQSSEATFTQLLDYNLPAKLSLIGKLTQSNHIHGKLYFNSRAVSTVGNAYLTKPGLAKFGLTHQARNFE